MEAHISDIHFGVFDPAKQYEILKNQFIDRIKLLDLDLISINGDLFHHKFMSNSDAVMYALKFVDELVQVCRTKQCTLFILHGTPSHDANQEWEGSFTRISSIITTMMQYACMVQLEVLYMEKIKLT